MPKLVLEFSRGGVLTAEIFDKVPETWKLLKAFLPVTTPAYNARWSGRESYAPLLLPTKPPRENQANRAGIGDVIYAYEWEPRDVTGFEGVGWFYGAESIQDWRGPFPVNHIGRISQPQWPLIEEIGLRAWKQGGEKVTLKAVD